VKRGDDFFFTSYPLKFSFGKYCETGVSAMHVKTQGEKMQGGHGLMVLKRERGRFSW